MGRVCWFAFTEVERLMIFLSAFSAFTRYWKFDLLVPYSDQDLNFRRNIMWTKPTATDLLFAIQSRTVFWSITDLNDRSDFEHEFFCKKRV